MYKKERDLEPHGGVHDDIMKLEQKSLNSDVHYFTLKGIKIL